MPATLRTTKIAGSTRRSHSPPDPSMLPSTLPASARAGTRSGRRASSARSRAARRRSAIAGPTWAPRSRTWQILLAKSCSFIGSKCNAACLERSGQCVRRPGAMRFHAAFRASHGPRSLRDVEFLPVTQQERFALTARQAPNLLFNDFKDLSLLQLVPGRVVGVRLAGCLQSFERVLVVVVLARRERREEGDPQVAHLLAPEPVADRVLQDALEEERQLGGGPVAIELGELQHRVLRDVERCFVIPDGIDRLLESAPLDT